jgi:hypothetical protein
MTRKNAAKLQESLGVESIGAPGAARFSSTSPIPDSPPAACQADRNSIEPECAVSTCMPALGGAVLSRRNLMNMIVSTAAITAMPAPAAALPLDRSVEQARGVAALRRAQEIVDILRERWIYLEKGWEVDEAAAERTLEYFRRWAADGSDDDDLREAANKFLSDHGQSLDWVYDGDPCGMIRGLATHSRRAVAAWPEVRRVPGDELLWALYDKFERAYNRMKLLDTPEAMKGSLSTSTPEQQKAFKKWERAGNSAFRAARRVLAESALTNDGLLMKIHVAGFEFDAQQGTFTMPYRGLQTPDWSPSRFSTDEAHFIVSIGEDLKRAKKALR